MVLGWDKFYFNLPGHMNSVCLPHFSDKPPGKRTTFTDNEPIKQHKTCHQFQKTKGVSVQKDKNLLKKFGKNYYLGFKYLHAMP